MPIYSKELGQDYKVFKENGNIENETSSLNRTDDRVLDLFEFPIEEEFIWTHSLRTV